MMEQQQEIYPMPIFPTFQVQDVGESVEWYKYTFDFIVLYERSSPDGVMHFAHLRKGKYQDVLLVTAPSGFRSPPAGRSVRSSSPPSSS